MNCLGGCENCPGGRENCLGGGEIALGAGNLPDWVANSLVGVQIILETGTYNEHKYEETWLIFYFDGDFYLVWL